jgi:hypothetical protein
MPKIMILPVEIGQRREEETDGGNYMAVKNLKSLRDHASMLLEKIDASTPLPDWVEAKLTQSATHLLDVTEWAEHGSSLGKKASRLNWAYNRLVGMTYAETPMGTYTLWPAGRGIECRWNNKPVGFIQGQDFDAAKKACQSHYVSGVFPKNQGIGLYASKRR